MISYFKFEVKPWYRAYQSGEETRTLEIQVNVNGEEHHISNVLPGIRPFETELEHYAMRAIKTLEAKLRDLEAQEHTASDVQVSEGNDDVKP